MLKRRLHHGKKRKNGRFFVGLLVITLFVIFFVILPVLNIKKKGKELVASARTVKDAFKENDIDLTRARMQEMQAKFDSFQKESKKIYWLRFIPIAGGYVSDFKNGVEAGDSLLKAGFITVDTIAPYADLIGFKKGASFADKSADDRLQTAVLTLDKVVVKVDDIAVQVDDARKKIEKINEKRYPGKYGVQIKNAKDQFEGVASLFVDSKPFLKKLPEILGTNEEKTYLVLFQNDKELRPTGGFLTAYAVFKVKNGKFIAEKSEDIYHLDASIANHPVAPKEILTYHKGVSQFNIRDSNLSPDFVESIKLFESLYVKSNERVKYDGIIAVDTNVLVDTLSILGDTQAGGITFSSQMDARCDCPQVIYALLNEIDRPVNYLKINRKGMLGELLYAIMQKALAFSPSQYWGKLSQSFIEHLQEKHMLVNLKDQDAQKAIEAMNFGGRIQPFDGDYLHISDTNFAGAKSNLFVKHNVVSETIFENDGTVRRKITINYRNPYKYSDCNLERGNLCLNATLRNWLRIYVPEGSTLVNFKGSETKVNTYNDLGKTVFEGFMRVQPLGKATVTLEYTLPNKMGKKDYALLIQKQPGTAGHDYTIEAGGKRETFKLIRDYKFKTN